MIGHMAIRSFTPKTPAHCSMSRCDHLRQNDNYLDEKIKTVTARQTEIKKLVTRVPTGIRLASGTALAWPFAARAQQANRMGRIGLLINLAADDPIATPSAARTR